MSQEPKLYVGNLSFSAEENELQQEFGAFGNVTDVKIIKDRETGRSRGFGFVTFDTIENAHTAVEAMNGRDVGGRQLRVSLAKSK